jgi:hypothetical protein
MPTLKRKCAYTSASGSKASFGMKTAQYLHIQAVGKSYLLSYSQYLEKRQENREFL